MTIENELADNSTLKYYLKAKEKAKAEVDNLRQKIISNYVKPSIGTELGSSGSRSLI